MEAGDSESICSGIQNMVLGDESTPGISDHAYFPLAFKKVVPCLTSPLATLGLIQTSFKYWEHMCFLHYNPSTDAQNGSLLWSPRAFLD